MKYTEEENVSKKNKELYLSGLKNLVSERQKAMAEKRREYIKDVFTDTERYRSDFRDLLGWPLTEQRPSALPSVRVEKLSEEDGYVIYRMGFDVLDGLTLSGLYFEIKGDGKRPLVLVQHGGLGTPELISGVYGSTSNYNDMLKRVVLSGAHAFAPQLFLWDEKRYGVSRDRIGIDSHLRRLGSSITAVEIYGLMRVLDYFEAQENVLDLGMVGLSYGGFYTLFTAALDTRIRSALSCSFFNTRDDVAWSDWSWFNIAERFDDAEIACMVYPRKLCIEVGTSDPLFKVDGAKRSFKQLEDYCRDIGTDWVKFIPFEGKHEFCKSDEPIKELIRHLYETE